MRRMFIVVLLLATPCLASGQAQPPQPAKPGPEVQKLAPWVGSWSCDGENEGGKYTFQEKCEWFTGEFFLLCRWQATTANGDTREVASVEGYSQTEKAYTYYRYDSVGGSSQAKGSMEGDAFVFLFPESKREGKVARTRMTARFLTPSAWTFNNERSVEGGPWTSINRGKCNRVK